MAKTVDYNLSVTVKNTDVTGNNQAIGYIEKNESLTRDFANVTEIVLIAGAGAVSVWPAGAPAGVRDFVIFIKGYASTTNDYVTAVIDGTETITGSPALAFQAATALTLQSAHATNVTAQILCTQ